ncbi:MAG: hypothetical protein M1833_002338 [Piccolia ochrophora]|nr:MAG: hypothetical protein M1833_002338 [Piccolia ochrophora]
MAAFAPVVTHQQSNSRMSPSTLEEQQQRSYLAPMNANPPSQPHPHQRTGQSQRGRLSGDQRNLVPGNGPGNMPNGNGAMPVPAGPHGPLGNGQLRTPSGAGNAATFDGPRSPPGSKNTSHVPCKFFRQGACQAGKACPFSHSLDPTNNQTPCKYFAKGNCKFGAKCALAHILPDGRRVNRPIGGGPLNLGNRVNPETYHNQGSALANSLLKANMAPGAFGHQIPYTGQDDYPSSPGQSIMNRDGIPTIDTSFSSHPTSAYGSPRDDVRLPMSPVFKGLSTLDAPLPASFDSNGISWIARNGPVAASVPSKFGLESPPHSFKEAPTSDALRNLHDSAFGTDNRGKAPNMGSSPPPGFEQPGQRIMHSQRYTKPKMMSASLPRAGAGDDWDGDFAFEEDFIPNSLHELLTPQEKMRRLSRTGTDEDGSNQRPSFEAMRIPRQSSSNVGSPPAASPSRFGPLFTRQRRDDDQAAPVSGFGHVGSPLRTSSLNLGTSPGVRAISRPTSGDVSPHFASPPRHSSASMSVISQQLQRTSLSRDSASADTNLHPSSARFSGNATRNIDRAVSSSSISTGRFVPSIDEEQGEIFSLEEEEDTKRYSGGWNYPVGGRSPRLNAMSDRRTAASTMTEGREGNELLDRLYGGER